MRLTAALLVAAAVALPACSGGGPVTSAEGDAAPVDAPSPSRAASLSPSPTVSPAPAGSPSPLPFVAAARLATSSALPCPSGYAQPDPRRPVLDAAVTVDGGLVTGTSRLVFTPDLATGELVFRLWAAAPRPRAAGGRIDVTRVVVQGVARTTKRPAPTLLRIPLAGRTPAGKPISIELSWRLRLPTGANDRLGVRGQTAWFGSGLPLLAWVRGTGWAVDPETASFAEATTSEVFALRSLSVTRAAGLRVLATGTQVSDDGRTAVFRARAVRDLLVATGPFRTATASSGGKQVLVGVAPGMPDDPTAVAREMARALGRHAARFGVFPYERLVVAVVPDLRGGVEQPAGILLGEGQADDATGSHEVAHEWWYGLVGNNQARSPWLDEAFATYAEGLDRGTARRYASVAAPADGLRRVGAPMTYWEGRSSYYRSVYLQGARMLLEARQAAGAAAFDSAMVCHVRRFAHRVTTPADLEASFRHLPRALEVLRRYGAL